MSSSALPWSIRVEQPAYEELAAALKQLDGPFGEFGMDTLAADTNAIKSESPSDATYTGMDAQLEACASARSSVTA